MLTSIRYKKLNFETRTEIPQLHFRCRLESVSNEVPCKNRVGFDYNADLNMDHDHTTTSLNTHRHSHILKEDTPTK